MLRFTFVLAGVIACVLGMLSALRIGHARSMVNRSRSLATVTEAMQLSPHDPDLYLARAAILANREEVGLAIDDLKCAIALRPRDHKSWNELARLLAKKGDNNSALAAQSEARALAPFKYSNGD